MKWGKRRPESAAPGSSRGSDGGLGGAKPPNETPDRQWTALLLLALHEVRNSRTPEGRMFPTLAAASVEGAFTSLSDVGLVQMARALVRADRGRAQILALRILKDAHTN